MLSETLGLGSSVAVGAADFIGGLQTRRRPLLAVLAISQTTGLLALLPFALIIQGAPPSLSSLLPALAAGVLLPVAISLLFSALAMGKMGIVAPITGTNAIVPVVVGIAGGERPGDVQIAGMMLCLVGVVLVAAQADSASSDDSATERRGTLLAIIAVPVIGLLTVFLAKAGEGETLWAITVMRCLACSILCTAAHVNGTAIRDSLHANLPPLMAIGLLDTAGMVMFLSATKTGLLSVVAVLLSLYPAVTVLLARVLLDERLRSVQLAGAMIILAGIAALGAGQVG